MGLNDLYVPSSSFEIMSLLRQQGRGRIREGEGRGRKGEREREKERGENENERGKLLSYRHTSPDIFLFRAKD